MRREQSLNSRYLLSIVLAANARAIEFYRELGFELKSLSLEMGIK